MTTSNTSRPDVDRRAARVHRFFGVVTQPQTYRSLAYALLGLPLGIIWFTVLATGATVGAAMLTVALAGIPILLATWHLAHWCAIAERGIANGLLGTQLVPAPSAPVSGNLWRRLRATTADRVRQRELGFVLARLPIGITTFALATTLLVASAAVAYAPIHARISDRPFGTWSMSDRLQDVAASDPWAWILVPAGALAFVASLHAINRIAGLTARTASTLLGDPRS